jgi:hypothetical protein
MQRGESKLSTPTVTPYQPAKPDVVRWVENRCERIAKAYKSTARFQLYRHSCLALADDNAELGDQAQRIAALDTIRWAAWAAGMNEETIKRHADSTARAIRG